MQDFWEQDFTAQVEGYMFLVSLLPNVYQGAAFGDYERVRLSEVEGGL